jgi:hypothetical protein
MVEIPLQNGEFGGSLLFKHNGLPLLTNHHPITSTIIIQLILALRQYKDLLQLWPFV